ncbi:MAG TPA: hypothetical protein VGG26_12670 [Terracidiphilus sp.]
MQRRTFLKATAELATAVCVAPAPALTLGATYDEMDPEDMIKMAKLMQNATSAICPNGSHLSLWDDQDIYFQHMLGFLRSV